MKQLFSLYRRNGIYYAQNTQNGKQESLRTRDEAAAKVLLHSKNEASRQPILNHQIALAYLSATNAAEASRTWKFIMDEKARPALRKSPWHTTRSSTGYVSPSDSAG